MHFKRYGKTHQLRLDTPDDLREILGLDQSFWVATSAPACVFRCDPKFTALLDHDGTGRITTNEVQEAVRWLLDLLRDCNRFGEGTDVLALSAVNPDAEPAKAVLESARYVLDKVDAEKRDTISLREVREFVTEIEQRPLNGDGIIVPHAAGHERIAAFITDAVACVGGAVDAGGKQGITEKDLNAFCEAITGYLEWREQGQLRRGEDGSPVMPLGADTPDIYAVYSQHSDKVDLFYALCRALQFEPRAAARVGCVEADLSNLDFTKAGDLDACLARAPLARPAENRELPLDEDSVNPLYRAWISELKTKVLARTLDEVPDTLTEKGWQEVKDALHPHEAYLAAKKGACVEKLPVDKLEAYRDGDFREKTLALIEADKRVTSILAGVREVERLLLYHQNLLRFVNNFVNFSQLYDVKQRSLFEEGSAVIDGRWFNLALRVDDLAAHSKVAADSSIFTVYLEVKGKDDPAFNVAVPATAGSKGNLAVGKRGVFFDVRGREYDARIVKLIENPISVREALVAPFVRLWSFLVGKIETMSTSSEKELQKSTDAALKAKPGAPGQPAAGPSGLLVGLSLSAAAISSAFAFVTKTLTGMAGHKVLLGFAGAVMLVMVPVSLIAILKLRRQDLSALLEGCGWAINARMRLTRTLRRQFTKRLPYPPGSTGTPRRSAWLVVLLIVLAALAGVVAMSQCWVWPVPSQ